MTKRLLCAALFLAAALPTYAGFGEVARAIDHHRGLHRRWVPGLGIARFLVWVVRPKGVHDFQLVTYEGRGEIDPQEMHALMQSNAGEGYTPLVRVWSRKSGEWSFVYARSYPKSTRMELMILAHDDEDTVLVRVDVDAEVIARELGDPRSVARYARQ